MSELLDKMNQQFTDMHKLALDFEAMAQQAIKERDKARERVTRLEGALYEVWAHHSEQNALKGRDVARSKTIGICRNALEGK